MFLVDEAGKASTKNLDRLRALADERGAVIRLVGDPQQLGSAAAGGAFRLLARELGAAEMLDVLRFRDPKEAAASLQLRSGDQAAADYYTGRGRVHEGTTVDVADQVYRGWVADREAGRSTIMMAASNAAVAGLNERAQAELRAAGAVSSEATTPLRDEQTAGIGDVILTRRNDRRITVGHRGDWIRNGSLFTVRAIGRDGSLRVQRIDGDGVTTLPADYVTTWVDLGYASTIDRAQGITVDTATGHRPPRNDPPTAVRGDVPRPRREPRPHRGRAATRRGCRTRSRRPHRQGRGPSADHRPRRCRAVRHRDDAGRNGRAAPAGQPGAGIPARRRNALHRASAGEAGSTGHRFR